MRETLAVSERRACRVLGQVRRSQRYASKVADEEAVLTARGGVHPALGHHIARSPLGLGRRDAGI